MNSIDEEKVRERLIPSDCVTIPVMDVSRSNNILVDDLVFECAGIPYQGEEVDYFIKKIELNVIRGMKSHFGHLFDELEPIPLEELVRLSPKELRRREERIIEAHQETREKLTTESEHSQSVTASQAVDEELKEIYANMGDGGVSADNATENYPKRRREATKGGYENLNELLKQV